MTQKAAPKISLADQYLMALQNAERALASRNQMIIMLEGDVARLGGTKRDWGKKARELERVLEEAGGEVGGLQARLLALDEALKAKGVEADEREARVRELAGKAVDEVRVQRDDVGAELDRTREVLRIREAEIGTLRQNIHKLDGTEQDLRRQVAKLEAKGLKHYIKDNADLRKRLFEKSKEVDELQRKVPTRIPLPVRQVD